MYLLRVTFIGEGAREKVKEKEKKREREKENKRSTRRNSQTRHTCVQLDALLTP